MDVEPDAWARARWGPGAVWGPEGVGDVVGAPARPGALEGLRRLVAAFDKVQLERERERERREERGEERGESERETRVRDLACAFTMAGAIET